MAAPTGSSYFFSFSILFLREAGKLKSVTLMPAGMYMCEENKQTFVTPDGSMDYLHEILRNLKILGNTYT